MEKRNNFISFTNTAMRCVTLVCTLFLLVGFSSDQSCFAGPGLELSVTFTFSDADLTLGTDGNFDTVSLEGGTYDQNVPGLPAIPIKYVNILLPSGAEVVGLSATSKEHLVASNILLNPVQPPRIKSAKVAPPWVGPNVEAYSSTVAFPALTAELVGGTQMMRGWCIAEVKLMPVRYIAVAEEIYLADEIVVTIQYTQGKRTVAPVNGNAMFEQAVKKLVVNPDQIDAAPVLGSKGELGNGGKDGFQIESVNPPGAGAVDYLIITPQSLQSTFQILADHRANFNGWDTAVVTTEYISSNYSGVDIQDKIRNCIIYYVNNQGTTFVVLGGDENLVPDRNCYVNAWGTDCLDMPTDHYYAGLDGNWNNDGDSKYGEVGVRVGGKIYNEYDKLVEVYVGRIGVENAGQAAAYIYKVKAHEHVQNSTLMHKVILGGWEAFTTYEGDARPNESVCDGHIGFRATNHPYVSDDEAIARIQYRNRLCNQSWPTSTVKILYDTLNSWDNTGTPTATCKCGSDPQEVIDRVSEGWHIATVHSHGGWQGIGFGGDFSWQSALKLYGPCNFLQTSACLSNGFDIHDAGAACLGENMIRNPNGGSIAYIGTSRENATGIAENLTDEFLRLIGSGSSLIGQIHFDAKNIADLANEYERWVFYGLNLMGDPGASVAYVSPVNPGNESNPPTPNPATFASDPVGISMSAITMTATTGTDASMPVQYYFDETSGNPGGSDSGWQMGTTYTDLDLNPSTQYTYKVKMRDTRGNVGTLSVAKNATTYPGTIITDDFEADRNYLTQGVSGTIWDGLITTTVASMNTTSPTNGKLCITARGQWWYGGPGPLLYKNVSGDFSAKVQSDVTTTPYLAYEGCLLLARVANLADAGAGEDWTSVWYHPTWSGNSTVNVDNGTQTEVGGGPGIKHLKLERSGNVFSMSISSDGSSWSAAPGSPITRSDLNGLPVQLGLAVENESDTLDSNFTFDNFQLILPGTAPTPTNTPGPTSTPTPSGPGQATNPTLANGATGVPKTNVVLSWTAGAGATSHDVYFGTTNPPQFKQNQTGTTYNAGTLTGNKNHYWRIDEKNASGTTTGVVWTFKTAR